MSRSSPRPSSGPAPHRLRWVGLAVVLFLVVITALFLLRDTRPVFDGEAAFSHVEAQVAQGPRVPGTAVHAAFPAWLEAQLAPYADAVNRQPFTYPDARDSTQLWHGTNIVASFNLQPEGGQRIMLAAHWDTRPTAEQDPDSTRRARPSPGANDGGSGVGVLLEMARLLADHPPAVGVDLVFFDLEDIGDDVPPGADTSLARNPFAIGSERFAAANPRYRPQFGILLDMVGDAELRIPQEAYSRINAPGVVERVWAAAERVGATAFVEEAGGPVVDDHIAFLQRGIPVINLIHYPFPSTWHTHADTPARMSAASLQQVGDVLVEVLYGDG